MNRLNPLFILLGLVIQATCMWLIFDRLEIVLLSSLFSSIVLCIFIIISYREKAFFEKEKNQHYVDIDLLKDEIARLQKFNKAHLTTIRKLKSYSKNAVNRLNQNAIDFFNTAECMDNPVLLVGEDLKISWANKAAEDLYGYSKLALNMTNVFSLMSFPENMSYDEIVACLHEKGDQEVEVKVIKSDGTIVLTHTHFTFQKNKDKEIMGVLLIQTDMTEIRENEENLRKALEQAQFAEKELQQFIDKQLETNERLMIAENKLRAVLEKEQESKAILNQTLEALKDTQGQLIHSEKMASLGQLTAGIAHEINNPVNFIYNGVGLLKKSLGEVGVILDTYSGVEGNLNEVAKEKIKSLKDQLDYEYLREDLDELVVDIEEGAIRTIEIVKGLRVFSRLDEEDQKDADINECLDATISLLQNKTKGNVNIIKEYDDDLGMILCYPGQLNQVFMNMINNSIQAFNEDQNDRNVTIRTKQSESDVIIEISDNGIGISEEVQRRIFEPFYTTKPVGVGTGLGLSISFGIIEKHNGNISLDSQLGEGTTFKISIPKQKETVDYARAI